MTLQTHYTPSIGVTGPLRDGRGFMQVDDLGIGTVEGMETHGYRTTITFNPGTMGNDSPMVITREFWFSPQLRIDLSSLVDNPQSGRQVFTVKELSTSEPDPALFEVPEGCRIVDHRSNPDQPNLVPDHP